MKDALGIDVSDRTVRRWCRALGFRFYKVKNQHFAKEKEHIVKYRTKYCKLKQGNRRGSTGNDRERPVRPEIYLDETYCHVNHRSASTWAEPNGKYALPSKGSKFIIVGAGAVFVRNRKLRAEWVPGSLRMWDPAVKPKKQTDDLPPFLEDYHGNMNAANFERWFQLMCESASNVYGPSNIYMDSCSSHKRLAEAFPTAAWKKAELQDWLKSKDVVFDPRCTKPTLLSICKDQQQERQFVTCKIAEEFGHKVYWTPPYHPELQPIETIWAVAKNKIAQSIHANKKELEEALHQALTVTVSEHTWLGARRRVLAQEDEYSKALDDDDDEQNVPLSSEEESDSDSSNDEADADD